MAEVIRPDICVIGASPGGVRAAVLAAGLGVPVVLVEKGEFGHALVGAGRLPLTALIAAGKRASTMAHAPAFGVKATAIEVDFARVHAHVQDIIAAVAPNVTAERLAGLGVRVIRSPARFKDRSTLAVGTEFEIVARRFVIATGSAPALPPIPGLEATPHLTLDSLVDLTVCPEHLIVLGAGPDGLECAQALFRLGAAVTVLDEERPLPQHDPECVAIVLDQFAREGIPVRQGTVVGVEPAGTGAATKVHVHLRDAAGAEETIEGSHLLVTGPRWANVVGLGLDAAGIKYDERGIATDKGLRTSNRRVYAIGDVAVGPSSPHSSSADLAEQQAELVVRNALLRLPVRFDPATAPAVTFTDPELAQVGLTEAQAARRRIRVGALRWPYRENDRAVAERTEAGHIKLLIGIAGRTRGLILGVSIVGAGAGELISAWTPAIGRKGRIRELAGMIVPYPTLAAIGKSAAATFFTSSLTSPWARRIIGWMRRVG